MSGHFQAWLRNWQWRRRHAADIRDYLQTVAERRARRALALKV